MKGKSYMRAQNRGNSVFAKMMTIVALMLTFIVTGAWAQQTYTVTFSADDYSQTISDATLPYNKTISCTDLNRWAESFSSVNVEKGDGKVSASIDGGSMTITVSGAFSGEAEVWCPIIDVGGDQILYVVKVTCVANAPAEPTATQFAVTLKEDTEDATSWQGKAGEGKYQSLPLEGVAAGTAVSVKYNGQRRVKSVKAVMKTKPAATMLSGALVDGAIIKVNFKWHGSDRGDYVQGVYNAASGTFTASKGGNSWGRDERAVYKVEKSGDNIIIGAGVHDYNFEAMVWTFNTTNDTYTTTNGDVVNDNPERYGLISVTLNGTDITSQLTKQ